jgi:MFS superfamily sulfate permease-like transporter
MSPKAEKGLQQQTHLEPVEEQRFEVYQRPGRRITLFQDAMAGLIVALVAIPLGIGFAIASGLKPEQGIVAGALAGILGGLFGGSKYQVYGPTAAFIPLLSGIVARYDVPFLILASIMAGGLILLMGLFKLGDHFSKIPFSVTVGFTIGIALSIALGQLPDTLGNLGPISFRTLEKIQQIGGLLAHPNLFTLLLAGLSFFIIRKCYKVSVFIPGPLIAILIALTLAQTVFPPKTIPLIIDKFGIIAGSELFKVTLPALGDRSIWALVLPVFSIVFIASLESLLSARMADRLANDKVLFNPNRELLGQGIVNAVVPLLNGFPCTGAFARTAISIKAGATSPAASIFQGGFILFLTHFFAGYIGLVPMACISGLLLYVAFNMIKIDEVRYVFKHGSLHTFLMFYTAAVTFLTDLLIAVSSATVLYYAITAVKKYRTGILAVGLCLLPLPYGLSESIADSTTSAVLLFRSGNGVQNFYHLHAGI